MSLVDLGQAGRWDLFFTLAVTQISWSPLYEQQSLEVMANSETQRTLSVRPGADSRPAPDLGPWLTRLLIQFPHCESGPEWRELPRMEMVDERDGGRHSGDGRCCFEVTGSHRTSGDEDLQSGGDRVRGSLGGCVLTAGATP